MAEKRIVFVTELLDACSWYRAHVPGVELDGLGYETALIMRRNWSVTDQADTLVFQRTSSLAALQDIERYKTEKRIVYDLDDNVWNLNPASPAFGYYNRPRILINIEHALRLADVVTTSTKELAERLLRHNKNVVVIPNYLPDRYWNVEKRETVRLTIGWAGSVTHWDDLRMISKVVEQVLDEFPDVELALAGMDAYPFRHSRIKKLEPVKLEEYPELLAQFDIGLAPLADDSFNECKSDLKFLEYAAVGIPVIASRVAAYSGSISNGVNGFLAKNHKDWLTYLRRLIEDQALRKSIGSKAKEFAESRLISKNIRHWESVLS